MPPKSLESLPWELILDIFSYFSTSSLCCDSEAEELISRRETLTRLARVAKCYAKPACEHLWAHLDGWVPLERLLPESCKRVKQPGCISYDNMEWSRFRHYAKFVTDMHFHEEFNLELAPIETLIERSSDIPVFPRLKRIKSCPCGFVSRPIFSHFSPGSLCSLSLCLAYPSENGYKELAGLLESVRKQAPSLEDLSLNRVWPTQVALLLSKPSNTTLSQFDNLRKLKISAVVTNAASLVNTCADLTQLTDLSVFFEVAHTEAEWTHRTAFGRLESLKLQNAPIGHTLVILHSFDKTNRSLRSLDIEVKDHKVALDGWQRCVDVIGARFAESLRVLRLEMDIYPRAAWVPKRQLLIEPFSLYFRALPRLWRLERVVVRMQQLQESVFELCVSEEDLLRMARAWRGLRELELYVSHRTDTARPSVRSFKAFMEHCPELRSLVLPFPVIPWGIDLLPERYPRSTHQLREIHLSGANWREERDYAMCSKYVLGLFPCAEIGTLPKLPHMFSGYEWVGYESEDSDAD